MCPRVCVCLFFITLFGTVVARPGVQSHRNFLRVFFCYTYLLSAVECCPDFCHREKRFHSVTEKRPHRNFLGVFFCYTHLPSAVNACLYFCHREKGSFSRHLFPLFDIVFEFGFTSEIFALNVLCIRNFRGGI